MSRFSYGYEMAASPERIRPLVARHVSYWRDLALPHYMGGPFADRSGGLIVFETGSLEEAETLVSKDPFVTGGVIGSRRLKEWLIE
jgi:hypothetical protein